MAKCNFFDKKTGKICGATLRRKNKTGECESHRLARELNDSVTLALRSPVPKRMGSSSGHGNWTKPSHID